MSCEFKERNKAMRYIIGVDLGGTQLRAALADEQGRLLDELRMRTLVDEGPAAVIDQIVACVERVRAALPVGGTLIGVGVGAPGPLDPYEGVMLDPPTLPGWDALPLRAILAERTGLPVELGNDANAAALGEWLYGAGRGCRNLAYVTVSTGIGGGIITDGRLLLGYRGAAAEVGNQIIEAGSRAFWEDLASGTGLALAAADAMIDDPASILHGIATPESVTAADVAHASDAGDALAHSLMEREGDLIGIGLVNLLHMYAPELILVGGSVVLHNPWLLDRARAVIRARAFALYHGVPVELAPLADRAGLLGAVALFLHMREGRA
jgi:glucokinase